MSPTRGRSSTTLATATDKNSGSSIEAVVPTQMGIPTKAAVPSKAVPSKAVPGKAVPGKAGPSKGVPLFRCRRRGIALETAIYEAVLQQLSTVGFRAMTIEGVAAAAQTGKGAIYRRWPSKEELVADTLDNVLPAMDLPLDTGNVRSDLAEIFTVMLEIMASPAGGAMQALMGELGHDHEFITTLHERVLAPRKALMMEIMLRGVARGDVRADAIKPVVVEAGPALLVHRLLTFGPPIDPAYMEAVLDDVVMPLIRP